MEFSIDRDIFLKSLGHANGIIEKKTTLPILSNILIETKQSKIKITATDLDIIYFEEVSPQDIKKEGSTTTSASVLYDILRKLQPGAKVELILINENKLKLVSGNSKFNLLCMPPDNFPLSKEDNENKNFEILPQKLLKLLNKTKISISNDETRHYLNGIFLHLTEAHGRNFLTGVATDSHRLSSSSLEVDKMNDFTSIILPRKTVFQLCSLLNEAKDPLIMQTSDNKIKFTLGSIKLISKVILPQN